MEKELTIVIPCKNEEDNIVTILENLWNQRIGSTKIFLADSKSTDNTISEAKKISAELGLNLEICPGGLPAKGRNTGARLSKTEFVLFVDADVTFTGKTDISKCLEIIKNRNCDILSTTPIYRGSPNIMALFLFGMNKISSYFLKKSHPFAIGAFTLVKKNKFLELGGYDESLKHTEDWWFSKQISPKKFILIPDLITQDDRRFKKFGYTKMILLFLKNWKERNNIDHFKKDISYWNHYN